MNEVKTMQELEKYKSKLTKSQIAFNNLDEESKQYVLLIHKMNESFSNWGLDLTSLSDTMGKCYPVSTSLINQDENKHNEKNYNLELWQLIRKFITLDPLKVKMDFQEDHNMNFQKLIFWGKKFLNMQGIDLLYMTYLLLEQQLHNKTDILEGEIKVNKVKILLPNMIATFEKNDITRIDFFIKDVGNLNILAKKI